MSIYLSPSQCASLALKATLPTDKIQLTDQLRIYPSDDRFDALIALCQLSKNLYNATLFQVRQQFFENQTFLNYATLTKRFAKENQGDFRALPAKVAQQTMKLVDQNFRSFFGSLRSANVEYRVNLPRYYPTQDKGLAPVIYTQQALSKKRYVEEGVIQLSQTALAFRPKRPIDWVAINQVRIIPSSKDVDKLRYITIEIVYSIQPCKTSPIKHWTQNETIERVTKTGKIQKKTIAHQHVQFDESLSIAGLDLNLNQLALATEQGSYLYNLRPAKSVNARYNKLKARYQGILDRLKIENECLKENTVLTKETLEAIRDSNQRRMDKTKVALMRLSLKRECWLKNFGHQLTTQLANQLSSLNISLLVIGQNKDFKQDVNLGTRLNQQFCAMPLIGWTDILRYKLQLRGIACLTVEESYTSKTDFLAQEPLFNLKTKPKAYQFTGRRKYRGLFVSQTGRYLNADINGAFNIMRKVIGNHIYMKPLRFHH